MKTESQYIRLEALIGTEKLKKLQNSRIAVIGCGAVGGFTLEPLIRVGIKEITIVDFDKFEISNLNRQLLSNHDTIGRVKVDVAKERILSINPECKVNALNLFLDESNAYEIVKDMDLVFDCIDNVKSKCFLIKTCLTNDIKLLSSMGAALKQDINKIKFADISKTEGCPLAKAVRQNLKKDGICKGLEVVFSPEQINRNGNMLGSMPTITATFGLMLAHRGIEYLLNKD